MMAWRLAAFRSGSLLEDVDGVSAERIGKELGLWSLFDVGYFRTLIRHS